MATRPSGPRPLARETALAMGVKTARAVERRLRTRLADVLGVSPREVGHILRLYWQTVADILEEGCPVPLPYIGTLEPSLAARASHRMFGGRHRDSRDAHIVRIYFKISPGMRARLNALPDRASRFAIGRHLRTPRRMASRFACGVRVLNRVATLDQMRRLVHGHPVGDPVLGLDRPDRRSRVVHAQEPAFDDPDG